MALLKPQSEVSDKKASNQNLGTPRSRNLFNIRLIIGREYKSRVLRRGFVISTLVLIFFAVVSISLPLIVEAITSRLDLQTKLVVVNQAGEIGGQELRPYFEAYLNSNYETSGESSIDSSTSSYKPSYNIRIAEPTERAALLEKVRDKKLDVLLLIERGSNQELSFKYYSANSLTGSNALRVQAAATQLNFLDRLARLNVDQQRLNTFFAEAEFETIDPTEPISQPSPTESSSSGATPTPASNEGETTQPTPSSSGKAIARPKRSSSATTILIIFGGMILLFTTINGYGATVAQGTAEEKGSRVMEIMICAVTPFQLMIGKIIGIGLVAFTQMSLVGSAALATLLSQALIRGAIIPATATTSVSRQLDVSGDISISLLGLVLLYSTMGFFVYAGLYAAVGSLVNSPDDLKNAMIPFSFLTLLTYTVSNIAIYNAEAGWVAIISYIPFFTPTVMLTRVGLGSPEWWEIPLSLVLMLVSIILLTWLAARVYRAGVLMYGQKPRFWRLLKLMFSK